MMSVCTLSMAQVVVTCAAPGPEPLRFGVPLPQRLLERGLRADGPAGLRMQWRALQRRPDRRTGRTWVQICLAGGRAGGQVRLRAGGAPACPPAGGVAARCSTATRRGAGRQEETVCWRWADGTVETLRFLTFEAAQEFDGATFGAGEGLSLGLDAGRFTRAGLGPGFWRRAGLLPGRGDLGREYRRRLLELVPRLVEMTGIRDRGDYRRSRRVVTNLEFDTVLAFARLGLAEGRPELLVRALRSALHTVDRDLDPRTNLLHRHGADHRSGPPDPGHTWLGGLLLVGCLAADERLIGAARRMARGLARRPAMAEARDGTGDDLVRDVGWPLLGMETWLRFEDDPEVAAAVGGLIVQLRRRFDAGTGLFRFGEGRRRNGVYEAPLWVTAGSLLPGLRAYGERTGDREVMEWVRRWERNLSDLLRSGRPGIPVRAWWAGSEVIRQVRLQGVPGLFMVLEGLGVDELRRCLRRRLVRSALGEVPAFDDPDLATSFSIVGRCRWILR